MAKKLNKKYHKKSPNTGLLKHKDGSNSSKDNKYNPVLSAYNKYYKQLLIIPILLIVIALVSIGFKYTTTGEFINKDVSLKGGLSIEIFESIGVDNTQIKNDIEANFEGSSVEVSTLKNLDGSYKSTQIISSDVSGDDLIKFLIRTYELDLDSSNNYQMTESEPEFSNNFFKQLIQAIIFAFLLMGAVVFIIFRVPVPSFAVIIASASDMIVTLAILNMVGFKMSSAAIAGFIMLIGYSVDTNLLLSSRVLKEKGRTVFDKIIGALKTGLTMTLTTLVVVTLSYFLTPSILLKQIMTVIFTGLVIDVINTWILNAGILRMYVERKKWVK